MKSGHSKEFIAAPKGSIAGQTSRNQWNMLPQPLGVIEVIHTGSIGTNLSRHKGILSVTLIKDAKDNDQLGKRPKLSRESIEFGDEDLEGATQPHDDALIATSRIRGFVVKSMTSPW